jgi:hypothetical protein
VLVVYRQVAYIQSRDLVMTASASSISIFLLPEIRSGCWQPALLSRNWVISPASSTHRATAIT